MTGCLPRRTFSLRGKSKKGNKNKTATTVALFQRPQKNDKPDSAVAATTDLSHGSKESLVLDRRQKRSPCRIIPIYEMIIN